MIHRIINPYMAYMLLPWYLDTWESIEKVCTRLFNMLFNDPQSTFCCVETNDGDETVKGIIIASKQDEILEISQMNGVDVRKIEEKLIEWGKSVGCKRVVIHTDRNPKAFERAYGFKLDETKEVDGVTTHTMSKEL